MMHRTTVRYVPDVERLQVEIVRGFVSLYTQSQAAEETGALFLMQGHNDLMNTFELGLIRTEDVEQIAGLRAMAHIANVRELSDDEILNLFMAT